MDAFVYERSGLSKEALTGLMYRLGGLGYVIQETDVRIRFIPFSKRDDLWESGRAFGEKLEIRWQPGQGGHKVLVLSEVPVDDLVSAGWAEPLVMTSGNESRVYLWGTHWHSLKGADGRKERLPHAWTEALIPGRKTLSYPLDRPYDYACLKVIEYQRNGMTLLTRFKGLYGEDREKGSVR